MTHKLCTRQVTSFAIAVFAASVFAWATFANAIENPDNERAAAAAIAVSTPATTPATATASGESVPSQLLVFPEQIELTTNRDWQSVVCQLVYPNGITRDVTHEAEWSIENPELVRRSSNLLYPVADGETQLTISADGFAGVVPIKVTEAVVRPSISFKNDVMPVFTKSGCNSGSCHGARGAKTVFDFRCSDLTRKATTIV